MFKNILTTSIFAVIINSTWVLPAYADLTSEIHALQTSWAQANYVLKGDVQINAFENLIKQAEATTNNYSDKAESWIWLGIIQSTYAGKAGPLDALSYAKAAKVSLEKAMNIDASALNGSAYASLGTLYSKVPGWPLGFGDDDKASAFLKKAVEVNPKGIDSNYFYADYLLEEDKYQAARKYLLIAQAAPERHDRPLADKGRQQEISTLLKKVNEELEYDKTAEDEDLY